MNVAKDDTLWFENESKSCWFMRIWYVEGQVFCLQISICLIFRITCSVFTDILGSLSGLSIETLNNRRYQIMTINIDL